MVQFVNNCKRYNDTIPKHHATKKRKVQKSNHKHIYSLCKGRLWGDRPWRKEEPYRYVPVARCIVCGRLEPGHTQMVRDGFIVNGTWYGNYDLSIYEWPLIDCHYDSRYRLVLGKEQ